VTSLPAGRVVVLAVMASSATSIATSACAPASPGPPPAHPQPTVRPAPGEAAPVATAPVPETLALVAGQFGLTMQAEGFTWKVLRRNVTRFDWSGRAHDAVAGDREVLYSFYIDKLDDVSSAHLPQIAAAAAANLTEGEPCAPIEQPAEIVKKLGVDRVVTVCFEPSTFYGGKEHHHAVLHAIVHRGALTIVAVLSNESMAIIPLPNVIGARGAQ
jgi:hypothetical protein